MHRFILPIALLTATLALAHHPLGGLPMATFAHGLLSGIGHPLLGFDHLFFIIAMGLFAGLSAAPMRAIAAYLGAMLAGLLLAVQGANLALAEAMIALSLLAVGGLLATGRVWSGPRLWALFAGFGLFHGAAYAGAITGQEGGAGLSVLLGYLIGLAVLQGALARAASLIAPRMAAMSQRLGGAMVAGAGLFLCLETAELLLLG